MTVVLLDPGHGGQDPGACWPEDGADIVEKIETLKLARLVRQRLMLLELPVAIELTREDDQDLSLHARGELGRKHGADLVLSIHLNSSPEAGAQGMITFARAGDHLGQSVARTITSNAPAELRRRTNAYFECDLERIKAEAGQAWLLRASNVLEQHRPTPAVVVECAHVTNFTDRQEISDAKVQRGIVDAMVMGVEHYLILAGTKSPAGGRSLLA